MKKIFLAFFSIAFLSLIGSVIVFAQTSDRSSSTRPFDISCMRTIVSQRETTIQSSFDVFYSSVKSSLQTRQSALLTAWSIADKKQRHTAIRDAWSKFSESKKSASQIFKQAKLAAWKQFKADRKNCRVTGPEENQGVDINI